MLKLAEKCLFVDMDVGCILLFERYDNILLGNFILFNILEIFFIDRRASIFRIIILS